MGQKFGSKAPPQHDAATPVHHCWDGILRLASLRLFPPNITMVIMAKQFYFCFIRPVYNFSKIRYVSTCAVANCSLAFLWQFWSSGFFLAVQTFRLCQYRTCFYCGYRYFCTCFLQHLHKVLCCCSGIDLHFSHQSTFSSRRQKASPS